MKPRLLLLDNYDSFTYNLEDYFLQLGCTVFTLRNDTHTAKEFAALPVDGIVLSPGPQTPAQAGAMMDLLPLIVGSKPILGVCLGHQAIGLHYGAALVRAALPKHGKTSAIHTVPHPLFAGLPAPLTVMRYHSLLLEDIEKTVLLPLAYTAAGELMAFAHPELPIAGVQFHPESILTEGGLQLLRNWLDWASL